MKNTIISLCVFLLIFLEGNGQSKNKYIIEGTLPNRSLDGSYITLQRATLSYEKEIILGRTKVKKGTYRFKGFIQEEPFMAYLWNAERKLGFLILEPGKIKVTPSSILSLPNISGTSLNEEYNREVILPKQALFEADTLTEKRIIALKEDRWTDDDELNYRETFPNKQFLYWRDKNWKFIENHLHYPEVILFDLSRYYNHQKPRVEKILAQLPEKIRKRIYQEKEMEKRRTTELIQKQGIPKRRIIENIPKEMQIGKPYINFSGKTSQGKLISLSEIIKDSKLVLLDFWASWCGPCMCEMPNIIEIYKQYKNKGLEIIGISSDEDIQQWTHTIKKKNMEWLQIRSAGEDRIGQLYSVKFIPCTILIDHEGKIIARKLRGEELKQKIKQLLE